MGGQAVGTLKLSLTYSNLSDSDRSRRIRDRMRLIEIKAPAFIRGLCGFSIDTNKKDIALELLWNYSQIALGDCSGIARGLHGDCSGIAWGIC